MVLLIVFALCLDKTNFSCSRCSVNGITVKQVRKPRDHSRASTYTTHFAERQRDASSSHKSQLSLNRSTQQTETYTTETASPIFPGASIRARKAVQATKVPLSSRERSPRQHAKTNIQPGQDLVPEQTLQMQETSAWKQSTDSWNGVVVWPAARAAQSGCACSRTRWWTLLRKRTLRFKYEHEYEHELRPPLHEHVPTTAKQPSNKQNMVTVKSSVADKRGKQAFAMTLQSRTRMNNSYQWH